MLLELTCLLAMPVLIYIDKYVNYKGKEDNVEVKTVLSKEEFFKLQGWD